MSLDNILSLIIAAHEGTDAEFDAACAELDAPDIGEFADVWTLDADDARDASPFETDNGPLELDFA